MKPPLVPDHWSAQEALAVFEFIDAIREEIWCRYALSITEQLQAERSTNPADWELSEDAVVNEDQAGDVPIF